MDSGKAFSTNYVSHWRNFYDIVVDFPGLHKERYVKYGMRQFGISKKTALKRLNDEIKDDKRLFVIEDPNNETLDRVLPLGPIKREALTPISIPSSLGNYARHIFRNDLNSNDFRLRLNAYVVRLNLIHHAIKLLDREVAESKGRCKFTAARNQLMSILIEIHAAIAADPDHDKIQPLIAIEVYPNNPRPYQSVIKPPKNPYQDAECLVSTKHFKMLKVPHLKLS